MLTDTLHVPPIPARALWQRSAIWACTQMDARRRLRIQNGRVQFVIVDLEEAGFEEVRRAGGLLPQGSERLSEQLLELLAIATA